MPKYSNIFELVDRRRLEESITELEFHKSSGLVSSESSKQLGQMTGATHLVYGIVDDLRKEKRKFSGFGIKTNNVVYALDLTVKVVDIESNKTAFIADVTHEIKELKTQMSSYKDSGMQKKLMKGAVKKAALKMNERFAPVAIVEPVTIPKVIIAPRGVDGNELDAEVEIDGEWAGNTPAELEIKSGKHQITITADGYKKWDKTINVRGGMRISPKLKAE